VSKAVVYDERTGIGMEYGFTGRAPDGVPIQLDWITPDGFIIDIKMRRPAEASDRTKASRTRWVRSAALYSEDRLGRSSPRRIACSPEGR
jgi:hypothetical protein